MDDSQYDIFVIGGGINGVGIAADAASRGLTVGLCEQNDFASGTSSASSKLIHGGLRYLEMLEFDLVRAALKERQILLNNAPHLITPMQFILPQEKHFRSMWKIRIGLFLYDHLASHPNIPNSKRILLKNSPFKTHLHDKYGVGFSYYDCNTDDARLVIENAKAARENGASLLPQTECLSCDYVDNHWKIKLRNKLTHKNSIVFAKVLVNAAGPWIMEVQKNVIHVDHKIKVNLIKGSHIVVAKLYEGNFSYILQTNDKRVIFTIPYLNDYTLIGTTDIPVENMQNIKPSIEEELYLFKIINHYFKIHLTSDDIIWSYAGVRSLQCDDTNNPSKITRDYKIDLLPSPPLLTVVSGKLTTYRKLSEQAVNQLKPFFKNLKKSKTKYTKLPGSKFTEKNFLTFYENLKNNYKWLPESLALRYAKTYGVEANLFLEQAKSLDDLGKNFSHDLYQKEVEYLLQNEWAHTSDDILWRRTKLGLIFNEHEIKDLDAWLTLKRQE